MGKRREPIRHHEIVGLFAERLRQLRRSRGMTQVELAREAQVTTTYVGKLENGGAAPGIDTIARLAAALGVAPPDLLPTPSPPDPVGVLQAQARRLSDALIRAGDRETLELFVPLLARLGGTLTAPGPAT